MAKKYHAGLLKSPYAKKYVWELEQGSEDDLSTDVYEYEKIEAKNKKEAVKELNKKYEGKYAMKKTPFGWNEGRW